MLGALLGVGGGILMVPFFTLALGKDIHTAVATSLAVIVVTSLSATLNHATSGTALIDWRLALWPPGWRRR